MQLEDQKKFFHGTLEITIFDATPFSPTLPFNCIYTKPRSAYVTVKINKKKVAKTSSEHDRVWNQTFQILCAHPVSDTTITITLKTQCSVLGRFRISAEQILTSDPAVINGFFPLFADNGSTKPNLKLKFLMWFRPAYLEPGWCKSLQGQSFQGIRNASFPQRSNCRVVLYQDAHHKATFDPRVHDVSCNARNLWEDVYKAIECARHLVYIAGWALNPNLVLVRRDRDSARSGSNYRRASERKAHEGVAVWIEQLIV